MAIIPTVSSTPSVSVSVTTSADPSISPSIPSGPRCENGLLLRDSMRVAWDDSARLYIQYFWNSGDIEPVTAFLSENVGSGCGTSSSLIDIEEDQPLEVRHAVDIVSAFNDGSWDGSAQSISVIANVSGQLIQMIVGYVSDTSSGAIVYSTSTGQPRDTCSAPAHAKIEISIDGSSGTDILTVKMCSNNAPGSSL